MPTSLLESESSATRRTRSRVVILEPEDTRRKSLPNLRLDLNPWIIFPLAAVLGFFCASFLNQRSEIPVSSGFKQDNLSETKSFHQPRSQSFSPRDHSLDDLESSETEVLIPEDSIVEGQVSSTSGDDLDDLVNKLRNLNRVLTTKNSGKSDPIALKTYHDAQLQKS